MMAKLGERSRGRRSGEVIIGSSGCLASKDPVRLEEGVFEVWVLTPTRVPAAAALSRKKFAAPCSGR